MKITIDTRDDRPHFRGGVFATADDGKGMETGFRDALDLFIRMLASCGYEPLCLDTLMERECGGVQEVKR